MISLIDVSNGYSFIDTFINTLGTTDIIEDIVEDIIPISHEIIKFTLSSENIQKDIEFLNESAFVSNFLADTEKVGIINGALLLKYFNSCIMFMPELYNYYVDVYMENSDVMSAIPNYELIVNANNIRLYYLNNILNLDETNSLGLMLKSGITSHQTMMLQLLETISRYGINLDGVSSYELLLRHIMNRSAYLVNPHMFDATFQYDGMRLVSRIECINDI
jgi:hypothetical protein